MKIVEGKPGGIWICLRNDHNYNRNKNRVGMGQKLVSHCRAVKDLSQHFENCYSGLIPFGILIISDKVEKVGNKER